jgi:hypothetical protein
VFAVVSFFCHRFGKQAGYPTKRAPDVWDSARFTGFFHTSAESTSQTLSTPAHTRVTQTVGTPLAQQGKRKNTSCVLGDVF